MLHWFICHVQDCYWSGKTAKDHDRSTHFMEEYCISVGLHYTYTRTAWSLFIPACSLMRRGCSSVLLVTVARRGPLVRLRPMKHPLPPTICLQSMKRIAFNNSSNNFRLRHIKLGMNYCTIITNTQVLFWINFVCSKILNVLCLVYYLFCTDL